MSIRLLEFLKIVTNPFLYGFCTFVIESSHLDRPELKAFIVL
jgi:hypothetical protein